MSRHAAIDEQHRLFPGQTLPQIALSLRAAVNGSADPWPDDVIEGAVWMLRRRLCFWDAPASKDHWDRLIDHGVQMMVVGACNLAEAYLAEQKKAKVG